MATKPGSEHTVAGSRAITGENLAKNINPVDKIANELGIQSPIVSRLNVLTITHPLWMKDNVQNAHPVDKMRRSHCGGGSQQPH